MHTRSILVPWLSLIPATLAACGGGSMPATAPPGLSAAASPPAPPPAPALAPPGEAVATAASRSVGVASGATSTAAFAVAGSAGVAAGEWDDNANYREFQKWLATEDRTPFHHVDVSDRRFLVVRDAQGNGVPRCPVTVTDAHRHAVTLTTTTSGRALLFPHAEGLAGPSLVATASCTGSTARAAAFSVASPDGVVDLRLPGARTLPATRNIDVVFILDTTGSMGEEIAAVQSTIQKVAASLDGDGVGSAVRVRAGMVAYKDRGDEYVTRIYPMTYDLDGFRRDVADLRASGGGDTPESVNEGVHVALSQMDWSPDAVGRYAFLIGDAPPHLDYPQDFDYAVDMKDAAHRGVQVFTIAASGMDDVGQVVWRQIAQYTDAANMFVLRGGAGPQSTGAGDPKSSCGGTQTNYASGNLDRLIVSKIAQQLRAIDGDPMRIAGLGQDEDAKPCAQRIAARD